VKNAIKSLSGRLVIMLLSKEKRSNQSNNMEMGCD